MQSIIVLSMKQPQEQKTMRGEIISYDPVVRYTTRED